MSFKSTMLIGVVLLGVALLVVMLHFTTPPPNHPRVKHLAFPSGVCTWSHSKTLG